VDCLLVRLTRFPYKRGPDTWGFTVHDPRNINKPPLSGVERMGGNQSLKAGTMRMEILRRVESLDEVGGSKAREEE
jgi:hypothetical protein